MKKFKIYPYKMGSESAKLLARSLNVTRVKPDGRYKYFANHIIINWGSSIIPNWWTRSNNHMLHCFNHPSFVKVSSNKVSALQKLKGSDIIVPTFFTDKESLIRYTADNGSFPTVYCRTVLNGHSGRGIVLANNVSELVNAPLYTLRFKAQREWRVHVFRDSVIDFAKKSRRNGEEERTSGLIRNYDSGWIFRRGDCTLPSAISAMAIRAVKALDLDFGAVDIAEDRDGNVCVYEVNCAPGMQQESTTLRNYTQVFQRYADSIR